MPRYRKCVSAWIGNQKRKDLAAAMDVPKLSWWGKGSPAAWVWLWVEVHGQLKRQLYHDTAPVFELPKGLSILYACPENAGRDGFRVYGVACRQRRMLKNSFSHMAEASM